MRAINTAVILMMLAGTLNAASLSGIIARIRQDPSDFSSWKQFREQSAASGTSEDNISRYEPVFIAVYDRQAVDSGKGGMVISAVILPGKKDGIYDINAPENNTAPKLEAAAAYLKRLKWYSQDGRETEPGEIRVIKNRLVAANCRGDIISTCPFINIGEVDEVNQDWRRSFKKAKKKDKSLGRLTWLFLSKNRHVWGIGYEITEEAMLPGQPMSREARLEMIAGTASGSCRIRF